MTLEEVNQTLRHMERLREDAEEADTPAEAKRLDREYGLLWRRIEPYVNGTLPLASIKPGDDNGPQDVS